MGDLNFKKAKGDPHENMKEELSQYPGTAPKRVLQAGGQL